MITAVETVLVIRSLMLDRDVRCAWVQVHRETKASQPQQAEFGVKYGYIRRLKDMEKLFLFY